MASRYRVLGMEANPFPRGDRVMSSDAAQSASDTFGFAGRC